MAYRSSPTGASRLVLPCNRGISENTNLKTHLIWARPQIAIPPCCINCLRFCSARRFLSSSAIAWISAAAGLPLVGRRLVLRPDGLAVWRRSAVGLPDVCAWDVCASFCASDVSASLSASPSTSLFLSLSRDTNAALSPIVLHEIVAPRLVRGSCVLLPPAQRSGLRQTQPSSTRAPNLIPRLQSLSRACWLHIASLLHQHQNWRPFSR